MTLSGPQWLALALMAKYGRGQAQHVGAGIWVPDREPWLRDERDAIEDDWIRIETLKALERRGLVRQLDDSAYAITQHGRAAAVRHGTRLWWQQQKQEQRA